MYAKEYEDDYDEILCDGISFFKKRCMVKKKESQDCKSSNFDMLMGEIISEMWYYEQVLVIEGLRSIKLLQEYHV